MDKDLRKSINRLRERCEEDPEISDADAGAILAFSDRIDLLGSEYSDERHEFHLMRLANIASSVGGLVDALEDRDAAEEIVRWIHRNYDNPETNRDYRSALRVFAKRYAETGAVDVETDDKGIPETVAWVPSGYQGTYDPAPDPGDMLHWEEHIMPMIEAAQNLRDKALIALAWDLGPRPGELYDLTLGAFEPGTYGWKVTVQGKQGQRSPTIIPAEPYVQQWISNHPAKEPGTDPLDDPKVREVPVWTKLHRVDPDGDSEDSDVSDLAKRHGVDRISYKMFSKIFKESANRAGVTRPVNPTNFRKSSAAYLASQGVSQAHIEAHHGWSTGSDIAARYISVFGDATEREVARAHGVDVSADEPDPTAPLTCPRCRNATPRHEPTCVHCHRPMDQQAVEEAEATQRNVREAIADLPREEAKAFVDAVNKIEDHPVVRAAFLSGIED